MSLRLSRIEIESAGSDPRRLADALLAQLPNTSRALPIHEIAGALDIVAIEVAPLSGIEGCLQCDPRKSQGQIVVRAASSPRRRRYTIAHELGHFLNERHRPTIDFGFACTAQDLSDPGRAGRHQQQELEANNFAIEVLTPRTALRRFLAPPAELDHALALAEAFEISREAAIRRYVALQGERLAVVFSREGRIRYIEKGPGFPLTSVWAGDKVAGLVSPRRSSGPLTSLDLVDAARWLKWPSGVELFAQTLFQENGFAATLLVAGPDEDAADDD